MELNSSRSLIVLRLSSALAALFTLIQARVLVILTATKVVKLIGVHGMVGYLSLLAMITATIAAFIWFRKGGSKGLVMHAGGVAVLMLVQIMLRELGRLGARRAGHPHRARRHRAGDARVPQARRRGLVAA